MSRKQLIGIVLSLFFTVGACGGDASGSSPQDALTNALAATEAAGSSRFTFAMTMTGVPGAPEDGITLTGAGAGDYRTQEMQMTMDMSQIPGNQGQGSIELIGMGNVMYMKIPATGSFRGDNAWIRMAMSELRARGGMDAGAFQLMGQNDPTILEYFRGASDDVEEVGTEKILGEETTHYRATVDLENAAENAPDDVREVIGASLPQLKAQLGTTKFPMEVWIDSGGLPRRVLVTMQFRGEQALVNGTMELSMDMFDYGVDVDVEPPPDEQVTDLEELTGQGSPLGQAPLPAR